jgi:hypothetical protein
VVKPGSEVRAAEPGRGVQIGGRSIEKEKYRRLRHILADLTIQVF